jgi:hypothetical protein
MTEQAATPAAGVPQPLKTTTNTPPAVGPDLAKQLADARATINALSNTLAARAMPGMDWLNWLIQNWPTAEQFIELYHEWLSITQPITDKTGLKSRLLVALKACEVIASLTPGTNDDAILATIDNVLVAEGGLDVLLDLVWAVWQPGTATGSGGTSTTPGTIAVPNARLSPAAVESHFTPAELGILKDRAAARAINWGNLIKLLPTIISIIQIFTGIKIPLPTIGG